MSENGRGDFFDSHCIDYVGIDERSSAKGWQSEFSRRK